MTLPELQDRLVIVAGMSRAGTTFLYHNLQRHPRAYVPARKELAYFAYHHDEGPEWFAGHYRGCREEQTPFDICGNYFMDPGSIARIQNFAPHARVILGVRNPVDWALSMHAQYSGNFDVPPLRGFVEGCSVRREGKDIALSFEANKIQETVSRFREVFGERLLLYDFRILESDALALLQEVEKFSGLPSHFQHGNFTDAKINATGRMRNPVFTRLMMTPGAADAVSRWVPRSLLMWVRGVVERAASSASRTGATAQRGEAAGADHRYLSDRFAQDEAFVQQLFENGPFVYGG